MSFLKRIFKRKEIEQLNRTKSLITDCCNMVISYIKSGEDSEAISFLYSISALMEREILIGDNFEEICNWASNHDNPIHRRIISIAIRDLSPLIFPVFFKEDFFYELYNQRMILCSRQQDCEGCPLNEGRLSRICDNDFFRDFEDAAFKIFDAVKRNSYQRGSIVEEYFTLRNAIRNSHFSKEENKNGWKRIC